MLPTVIIVIVLLNNFLLFINMSDKQKIINDIYFDRSGYGSKKTTLDDARKKISQLLWMMSMNFLEKMLK